MSAVETPLAPLHGSPAPQPKRRAQRPMQNKYPCSVNVGVTEPMYLAVQGMCAHQSPFTQSEIVRMALHEYLLNRSEWYRQQMGVRPK